MPPKKKKSISVQNIITQKALKFIRKNKKKIIEQFAGHCEEPSSSGAILTFFMAGSPGAGKTELSKGLIRHIGRRLGRKIVRIDADEIRNFLPSDLYTGKNSDVVQGAAVRGVEILYDHIIKTGKHTILDGTFVDLEKAQNNIERALKFERKRTVEIWYVYQDPLLAWEFTKQREIIEGRRVPKRSFIQSFFKAKQNVEKIKADFGNQVALHVIKKDYKNAIEDSWLDVQSVDECFQISYSETTLVDKLK